LARPEGIEPPTLGFEDRYSIQLSYGRAPRRGPDITPRAGLKAGARNVDVDLPYNW
jgi:hypothetical protein